MANGLCLLTAFLSQQQACPNAGRSETAPLLWRIRKSYNCNPIHITHLTTFGIYIDNKAMLPMNLSPSKMEGYRHFQTRKLDAPQGCNLIQGSRAE